MGLKPGATVVTLAGDFDTDGFFDTKPLHSNYWLTGKIPPELGNLHNLRSLSLRYNELTGPIPPEIGNIVNLQQLFIANDLLTWCIPGAVQELPSRPRLRVSNYLDRVDLPICTS